MNNGFVVYQNHISTSYKYHGVGTKSAWPLWLKDDEISIRLTDIAEENWFDYQNVIIQTVPDEMFVSAYITQCNKIHIPVSVFYLSNETVHFKENLLCLGYDCLGTTDFSYLYEDDAFILFKKEFSRYGIRRNEYGLFRSYSDCEKYIEIREQTITQGMNLEDAWPCTIVCIAKCRKIGKPLIDVNNISLY